jgi:hypothetical protein
LYRGRLVGKPTGGLFSAGRSAGTAVHMQAPASFTLVATFVGIVALAIALGATIGAPILAVPFFILGFGAFLVWRGKRRADAQRPQPYRAGRERVPSTEETAADPARDSGVADATRSASADRHRADAPGV